MNSFTYYIPEDSVPYLESEDKVNGDGEARFVDITKPLGDIVLGLGPQSNSELIRIEVLSSIAIRTKDGNTYPLTIARDGKEGKVNINDNLTIFPQVGETKVLTPTSFGCTTDSTIEQIIDYNPWVSEILDEFGIKADEGYEIDKDAWVVVKYKELVIFRSLVITDINIIKPYIELRSDIFKKDILAKKKFEDVSMELIPHEELFPILKELDLLGESI